MMTTLEAEVYLADRADNHGLSLEQLMDITPESVADSPVESAMFWEDKHMSHILPKSLYPSMANDPDNIIPEDAAPNMARGAEVMTDSEIAAAQLDSEYDALLIDVMYSGDTHYETVEVPDLIPFFGFI
jgi:hypothetical protein